MNNEGAAQADLHLRCLHAVKKVFFHDVAPGENCSGNINIHQETWQNKDRCH